MGKRRRIAAAVVAAAMAAAASHVEASGGPAIVDAVYRTSFVDVVWEPEEPAEAAGDGDSGPLPEEHFDVAVVDVFFDRPLALDGEVPLADLQQFMRTHRHHRQAMYGVGRLECAGGRVVESFPVQPPLGQGAEERPPHLLFPLPCATDSEFRWLNAVSGDFSYRLDSVGYRESNRVSFAVLLREQGHGRGGAGGAVEAVQHMTEDELRGCRVAFGPRAAGAPEWPVQHTVADANGAQVSGSRALRAGDEQHQHFHLVERGSPGAATGLPSSFLQVPFMDVLKPALIASAKLDDAGTKLPVDYVTAAMQDELQTKVAGGCAGSTAPGAVKMDGPSVYGATTFLEVYEAFDNATRHLDAAGATPEQKYLRFLETHGAIRERELVAATPADDVVDGKLTKDLIVELTKALTMSLSASLTGTMTDRMSQRVHDMLAEQLGASLRRDVAAGISTAVVQSLSQTLTESIPPTLERLLLPRLSKSVSRGAIETLTRALTHSIGGAITFTAKHAALEEPACYLCHSGGQKDMCEKCHKTAAEQAGAFALLDYYSAFYSDYYSDMYGGHAEDRAAGITDKPTTPGEA